MREQKSALRACAVCGEVTVEVLHHQKFALAAGHPLPECYDVVLCRRCGFAFADTLAVQHQYDRYYEELSKYDDAALSTGGGATAHDAARLRETAEEIARHLSSRDAAILDIGCATGGLLNELKKLGFGNVQGLDPSPQSAKFARENFGITIHTGGIFEHDRIGSFDCVILSHVLEHMRDLREALQRVRVLLKDGGLLYIEVPDATRYDQCLVAPFQDFNVEHINHFGPKSLNRFVQHGGFTSVAIAGKAIESAPGVPYPALFGFWKKTDDVKLVEEFDDELENALRKYIAHSRELLDAMDARLKAALWDENGKARTAVVWGAGQLTLKLLAETTLGEAEIECFVDGNSVHWGKELRSTPIVSPQYFREMMEARPELRAAPIVIGSTIHQDAITARVQNELMWQNPVVTLR